MNSLNIAMLSYYLPSGSKIGVGYQAHYMANAMVRRGHRVVMFSPCDRPVDALYDHRQVPVGKAFRSFRIAWEMRSRDLSEFDVLHAHGDDYWLWRRRVPCHVRTMHGSCFSEAFNIPRFKEKVRMLALAAGEVMSVMVADRTVGVSQNTCRSYPWIRRVIPNGVDLSLFHSVGTREIDPTILFVGTYRNRKRGKMLMEIFRDVVQPAVPAAKLWMVCSDAPEAENVKVFGSISTEELAGLYRRAWVFCLPSSYEGFGVPYIEAMASGTPVVATPNPGASEVLDGGRYGVLAEPAALGASLVRLLTDSGERERMTAIGLQRAKIYDWDCIIGQYETLYKEMLNR